ncbi:type VI secretion system baseplate subunit TssF [Photorhabdus sp. SF281]|uniref:type VI secretion system baseplate subunit TssF n=1 Tax=Photorhabdus sp. SF281 TaxID=3459527 RepID=UPI00404429BF
MDDLILRYYEAEMRYLREAGKEFAKAYPDRAAMLNLDRVGIRDPYVERLFEGFAFLMGRLREKLDDDLPELTEGLVSLLWPHYLRTIPSLSIVELGADWAQLQQLKNPVQVKKGFEVLSQPIGPQQTRCRYTTTQAVQLLPMALTDASLKAEPDGRAVIRLHFECGTLVDWRQIDLSRLPLYLSADSPLACALHRALTLQTQQLYLRLPGQPDRQPFDGGFSPWGFGDEERLWPKGDSAFSGYQLLLEYFTFREKFMFVTLCGLEKLTVPDRTPWFELDVVLRESWPGEWPFSAEHIRLHCAPVINLFPLESDPLPLSPLKTEYLLHPMRIQDGHTEIYSVDAVVSSKRSEHHAYVPFSSFRHKGGMLRHDAPERYYHTRVKQGPSGLYDTWLILGGEAVDNGGSEEEENLSLTMTGTHGQLPRRALQETLLDTAVSPPLTGLTVRNLCEPTLPCYPPNRDRFHWRVLSHLGSNFLSLMDNPEVLRGTLALYDWTDDDMNARRLAAIVAVKHALIERFEQGGLQRGVHIEVTLDSKGFSGAGDICLFGEMLSRFFALYTDIHLFNRLTLILQPTGERLLWQEKHSQYIPG